MKEEALKIDFVKVFVTYSFLGLIIGVGLILFFPSAVSFIYYIPAVNGLLGVLRERNQTVLRFSKKGLRISRDEVISWEDLSLTLQFSSKLFGKAYVVESKTTKLQDHLGMNWWNEEELLRLINSYTPERHVLRKEINDHEFGLVSQLSLTTKFFVNGFWSTISFDYVFLALICFGMLSVKYF